MNSSFCKLKSSKKHEIDLFLSKTILKTVFATKKTQKAWIHFLQLKQAQTTRVYLYCNLKKLKNMTLMFCKLKKLKKTWHIESH